MAVVLKSESEVDPSFDVLEHTRSSFSTLSINKKSSQCPTEAHYDDDDNDIDEASYEEIKKLIQVSKVDKLKVEQCKVYLKKHGLSMAGRKDTLIHRIKDHIDSTKVDAEADSEEDKEVEFVVSELDEKDQKSYEAIQNLIQSGKVDKLRLEQCRIYLKKHGLRVAGNKTTLIQRIKEHIDVLDGGGERKYMASSFVLNCKGDACTGDIVMFEQNVYEMFNIASRSATGPPCGTRTVAGRIIKESYGASKQQHTFTIEVLWSKGDKPLPPLHPLLIKGRNLYRIKTMRQKWEDEEERQKILLEKHARGAVARSNREARVMSKAKRAPCGQSKHGNNKRGPLKHPPQQERYECKNQQEVNHFHVNDKIEPILQHPSHVHLQQGWNKNKNYQKDYHFHGNDKIGHRQHLPPVELQQGWQAINGNDKTGLFLQHPPPVKQQQEQHNKANQPKENCFRRNYHSKTNELRPVQQQQQHNNQPKENHFHRNFFSPKNGQMRSNNVSFNPHPLEKTRHHHQWSHAFTNINMEHSRMIPYGYGGRRHYSNHM